jgi:hypothetical protein
MVKMGFTILSIFSRSSGLLNIMYSVCLLLASTFYGMSLLLGSSETLYPSELLGKDVARSREIRGGKDAIGGRRVESLNVLVVEC